MKGSYEGYFFGFLKGSYEGYHIRAHQVFFW